MWVRLINGKVARTFNRPKGVTINNIQYPSSIFGSAWSDEDRLKLGIVPIRTVVATDFDSRYHRKSGITRTITSTEVIDTESSVDKDVESLKTNFLRIIKDEASRRLRDTDWMVIRAAENGTPVPEDISAYRTAVRLNSNTKEVEVAALITMDEIRSYENHLVTIVSKTRHTAEDGTVSYTDPLINRDTTVSKVNNYEWAIDPTEVIDEAFVSIADR